ncbi:DoxX family protein [Elongatibacter sediminis]|uniref:DoxX family protein n=1 Tax=Elongatibacter sediminis TaxID=3119006 RepID=A0AAW9R6H8_9GAMM
MNDKQLQSWGIALTRMTLGVVALTHSLYLKGVIFTLPGTAQYFASLGLPAWLAYFVFAIEVTAGFMLLAGWRVRLAAAALIPVMLGATWAHAGNGWVFSNAGGGWEYPLLLAVMSLVQTLLGAGAFALGTRPVSRSGSAANLALES